MARVDAHRFVLFAGDDLLIVRRKRDREHRRGVRANLFDELARTSVPQLDCAVVANANHSLAVVREGYLFDARLMPPQQSKSS